VKRFGRYQPVELHTALDQGPVPEFTGRQDASAPIAQAAGDSSREAGRPLLFAEKERQINGEKMWAGLPEVLPVFNRR
jgi:hypothetical protein